jgi:hypothetical protein
MKSTMTMEKRNQILLKLAEKINAPKNRDIEAVLDPMSAILRIKSLRTYDLILAGVIVWAEAVLRVVPEPYSELLENDAMFQDIDDCALFISYKYSDGLKPHRHVWDLAITSVVQPAYTVDCLVPGCRAELVVPHHPDNVKDVTNDRS